MLANATYIHGDDAGAAERDVGKDSLIPIFKRSRRLNKVKSEAEGRAVFDEFDECHFMIPGDQTYLHIEGVTDLHKRRFPRQWESYQAGREQINGEPLENWYELVNFPGLIDEMRAAKVRSVNDLAGMNDDFVGRVPGWREWREKARKYVAAQASKAALAEQNAEMNAKIGERDVLIAEMSARLAALESGKLPIPDNCIEVEVSALDSGGGASGTAVKRGPGRPPKAV